MSKISLAPEKACRLWDTLCDPARLPVSFVYGDVLHTGLPGAGITVEETDSGEKRTYVFCPDGTLTVTAVLSFCAEYGESEYTVWFENAGTENSAVLRDVTVFSARFEGNDPVLRGCLGDHENFYAAYERDLLHGDVYFRSVNGRATHIVFPYFDLVCGCGGYRIALGWAGTWDALFAAYDGKVSVLAHTCTGFCASLLPGEKVRTGLTVILPYEGRDENDAANLWREWFMKYNIPKADGSGRPLEPFTTCNFAQDTGLTNSDGSISERWFTWKPTMDKMEAEGILPDFRWIDAGWYCDPMGNTVPEDWWGTVGAWEADREKWPGGTLRRSNDACHKRDMRVLAWFEPERVTHAEELAKNHGYDPAWGIVHGNVVTSNIGNEACFRWTLERILRAMDENGIDMYREDNNSDPAYAWGELDRRDAEEYGIPRRGVNENKCICAHYRLWDAIIAHCAETGKCTFVDSCASGGGRNDIESMRRGVPLMRSDYDRTTASMRLSQTSSFCRWIPFHGSHTKETVSQLDAPSGAGSSPYVIRASFLPVFKYAGAFSRDPEFDFDLMRRNMAEWRSVSRLLTRDLYVLTPWHHEYDRFSWTVLAYDAPELGESILLAFRMEEAEAETYTAVLPFPDPAGKYVLTDADTGREETFSGKALRTGVTLTLKERKSSALVRIRRV